VSTNLPTGTHDLRTFRNFFIARASIAEAFILLEQGQMRKVRNLLLRAIMHNPDWLKNKGVLSLLVESIFGLSTMKFYRSSKFRLKSFVNNHSFFKH